MATASRSVIILLSLQAATKEIELYIQVFVYGTLKHGHENHERFCRGVLRIEEATIRGRIYDLPAGYPALSIPKEDVRANGTADYLADAETQRRLNEDCSLRAQEASGEWDIVYGELLTFDDPERRFPALDGLEGFHPGGTSLYQRVLAPIKLRQSDKSVLAWVYTIENPLGEYVPEGSWPRVLE